MCNDVSKGTYIELMKDPEVQNRFRRNLEQRMRKSGIWSEKYDERCHALAQLVDFNFVYAEQAMHGHPVYKHLGELCEKLGVDAITMLLSDVTTGEVVVSA